MRVTLQSTDRIVDIRNRRSGAAMQGRIWEGTTESGIPVQAVIVRIATPDIGNQEQFVAELKETKPPEQAQAFPLSMVI